jgi:hypothetical protein
MGGECVSHPAPEIGGQGWGTQQGSDLRSDVGFEVELLGGEIKPRSAIDSIAIEQCHGRHLLRGTGVGKLFRH